MAKKRAGSEVLFFSTMGAFTYDVSSRGGGGFKMLTWGGGGLSLADVSKNT